MKKIKLLIMILLFGSKVFSQTTTFSAFSDNIAGAPSGFIDIEIKMSFNEAGGLGSTNIPIMINPAVLGTPVITASATTGNLNYTATGIADNGGGNFTITLPLNVANMGIPIGTVPTRIVVLRFPVLDETMLATATVSFNNDPDQFVVYEDSNLPSALLNIGTLEAKVLPITLKTFTAERYGNARKSILNWTSSSEINGSHFDIERSLDAQSWSKIGTVNAVGNTTTETSYEFIDRTIDQARTNPEVVYYRLNKIDLDGSSEYTDIKIVHFEPITDVSVAMSPNPAINMLSVTINTPEKTSDVDVSIFDAAGKFVAKHTVSTNGISTIDVSNIPSGLYNVSVKMADKTHSNKIIISH